MIRRTNIIASLFTPKKKKIAAEAKDFHWYIIQTEEGDQILARTEDAVKTASKRQLFSNYIREAKIKSPTFSPELNWNLVKSFNPISSSA